MHYSRLNLHIFTEHFSVCIIEQKGTLFHYLFYLEYSFASLISQTSWSKSNHTTCTIDLMTTLP